MVKEEVEVDLKKNMSTIVNKYPNQSRKGE